jgi:hypothetical protein
VNAGEFGYYAVVAGSLTIDYRLKALSFKYLYLAERSNRRCTQPGTLGAQR